MADPAVDMSGTSGSPQTPALLLSTVPASANHRRAAIVVSVLLVVAFLTTLPFARTEWPRLPAFVVAQQSVLFVSDLITATLLLGQYSIQRLRRLNILAGGYLFTSLIVVPHALLYPGVLPEPNAFGAGPQSSAWLYLVWHAVLPVTAIVYGLHKERGPSPDLGSDGAIGGIAAAVAAAVGGVALSALVVTVGHAWLPAVVEGDHFSFAARLAVGSVLGFTLVALCAVSTRQPRSVLDVWLMVVMIAWLCAITLGSFVSKGRFDAGWYAGRLYAALASVLVLIVLLSEIIALYARTVRSASIERRERERRLKEMETVLAHLARVSEMARSVSALVHEVSQPLAAISSYLGAGSVLADAAKAEKVKQVIGNAMEQANRASGIIRHLKDFIARRETEKRLGDIPEMLGDAVRLALIGSRPASAGVEIRCEPTAQMALFDRIQIEQVVFNLVRNAVEAVADTSQQTVTITTALTNDNMVKISVADRGPGLSPKVRGKLFEPFVTTKATGLGIGLSICRFIVETHGGRLQAGDNPGGGTIFHFTLPRPSPMPASTL